MPTMALYASIGRVNTSFPVWTEPFKLNNQGVRFPGSRGVRVVYRLEKVLSTKSSLLPWLVTRLLPGRVAIALLKVIQSASSVSHDLQHITFLSTKIMKSFPSLSSLPHIALVHSVCFCHIRSCQSSHTDWLRCRPWLCDVWSLSYEREAAVGGGSVSRWVIGVNEDHSEPKDLSLGTRDWRSSSLELRVMQLWTHDEAMIMLICHVYGVCNSFTQWKCRALTLINLITLLYKWYALRPLHDAHRMHSYKPRPMNQILLLFLKWWLRWCIYPLH